MKLLIASDIHGDIYGASKVIEIFEREHCDKILILGDILYHGPRNDLPDNYAPKSVIKLFNEYKDRIIAVRGNCDAEVDQMVLDFPIMDDFRKLSLDGLSVFATHGHHYNTLTPPELCEGEIMLHGHTHIQTCQPFGNNNYYLNPGSVTIPKENNPKTLMIYHHRKFSLIDLDGNIIFEKNF